MHGQELRDLQKSGMDWYGQRLLVDGDYGTRSKWWYAITQLDDLHRNVVLTAIAAYKEGASETTPNRGPTVDKFMRPGGVGLGHPWCIAFQSWVLRESGCEFPYQVSAHAMIEWAKREGRVTNDPVPGDVYAFLYDQSARGARAGHGGIILGLDFTTLATLDGNVHNSITVGQRNRMGLVCIAVGKLRQAPIMPTRLRDLGGPVSGTR